LIPSDNPVGKVYYTVHGALAKWAPVWVVVDGINDGTGEGLLTIAKNHTDLQVLVLLRNQGKGAAVLYGLQQAAAAGYAHALTMDADGQHPTDAIPRFMAASAQAPDAMILGTPVFDASAPALRVKGRRVSKWWANLETL
jgi:glycosyltransferase involved in cell wall biosynthesis